MKSETVIEVDLARSKYGPWVNAVQGDGGTRSVSVKLMDNGKPWYPPRDAEATIAYSQLGGKKGLYNKLPDGRSAVSVSGNIVTAILAPQMLSRPGDIRASIVFNNEKMDQLTSFPFTVTVAPNQFAGAQEAEDYIRLQWLEDKLDEYFKKAKDSGVFNGPKGDPFTYADFTPEQLVALTGPQGPAGDNTAAVAAVEAANTAAAIANEAAAAAQAVVDTVMPDITQLKSTLADIAAKEVVSENMFDPSQKMNKGVVLVGDGSTSVNANYDSTANKIDIGEGNGGKTLFCSSASGHAIRSILQYKENGTFISANSFISKITLHIDCRYIMVSIPKDLESTYMLTFGSAYSTYIPYKTAMVINDGVDGSAVAAQISESIGHGMNVMPPDIATSVDILNADGTRNENYPAYVTTDMFSITPGQTYTIYGGDGMILQALRAYCFYDKNKEFISGWSAGTGLQNSVTVPEHAYYIRISFSKSIEGKAYFAEGNSKQNSVPEYKEDKRISPRILPSTENLKNKWFGKTIVGLGDSITQADGCEQGWIHRVANKLGMKCYNHGINGSTIAVKESDPTTRNPMVTRYQDLPDADIILVLAGSNDWFYAWTPIGTMDDRTNYTLYGALHNLISGLIQKYENGNVVFATPIKRASSASHANGYGYTLMQYCDILKEVCAYYGVPCLDANSNVQLAPFIEWQNEKYFLEVSDGQGRSHHDYTHPNDLGHEKIAQYFAAQIASLFY